MIRPVKCLGRATLLATEGKNLMISPIPVPEPAIGSLGKVVDDYAPHVTAELLATVLVETLALLETLHRQRIKKSFFGAFSVDCLCVDSNGGIVLVSPASLSPTSFQAPEVLAGGTLTPASDVYAVGALFHALMIRSGTRIHPLLLEILLKSVEREPTRRFAEVWGFRAAILDLLDGLGIAGAEFGLKYFLRDPVGYNHDLSSRLVQREGARIRGFARRGARRQALAELSFLFEIAPESPEAFDLLQLLRRGRRRVLALSGYVIGLVALFFFGASVVAFKLHLSLTLPFGSKHLPGLIVEPASEHKTSHAEPGIELQKIIQSSGIRQKGGRVLFRLGPDSRAILVKSAGGDRHARSTRHYNDGDVAFVSEGKYTISVEKPEFPQAVSEFEIHSGENVSVIETIVIGE